VSEERAEQIPQLCQSKPQGIHKGICNSHGASELIALYCGHIKYLHQVLINRTVRNGFEQSFVEIPIDNTVHNIVENVATV